MSDVTVFILARDEAANIAACIESARLLTDRVVVGDMESSDETARIARGAGAEVVPVPFEREFDRGRNLASESTDTEWIFFLDADERLTVEAAEAVKHVLKDAELDAYGFPMRNRFMGRPLQFQHPYKGFQLVRRGKFSFKGIHEPAQIEGQCALVECSSPIEHNSHPTISDYLKKLDIYTDLEADKVFRRDPNWEPDFREMEQGFASARAGYYAAQQLWRSGMDGWIYSVLSGFYEFLKFAKAYERTGVRSYMSPPPVGGDAETVRLRDRLTALFGDSVVFSERGRHRVVFCRGEIRFDFGDSVGVPAEGKVLMVAHASAMAIFGGGEVQLFETMRALARIGVFADCSVGFVERGDYDLYHFFSLNHCASVREAIGRKKPIVCSPIYWGNDGWASEESGVAITYRDLAAEAELLMQSATLLMPNSAAEIGQLPEEVRAKCRVVPNALSPLSVSERRVALKPKPYVLCVGRIETKKNQKMLIEAVGGLELDGKPLNVVLIGANPFAFEDLERPGVYCLGEKDRSELSEWYLDAACHVLPSYYETPGLVTMEALSLGCPVVCGDRGAEREYFGDYAEYADPSSAASIRAAILRAIERPREPVKMPSWSEAAEATAAVYEEAILRDRTKDALSTTPD